MPCQQRGRRRRRALVAFCTLTFACWLTLFEHQSTNLLFFTHFRALTGELNKKSVSHYKVAYVTYGHLSDGHEWRFQMFILDALETWLAGREVYYVLNKQWKTKYEEMCSQNSSCERIVPLWVDCPEGYYGASPCCKMEQGLALLHGMNTEYDFFSYQDDDMYIRTDYMDQFVAGLNASDVFVLTSKPLSPLGHQHDCSISPDYLYPRGQPVVYSKAALSQVVTGFTLGSVTSQCKEFEVTHDVGNPLIHWMYMIPEVRLPTIPHEVPQDWNTSTIDTSLLGVHGVGKPDTLNTKEVHLLLNDLPTPQPPFNYHWHRPTGFMLTQTYHLYGNASSWKDKWHTMPVSDCKGPVFEPATRTQQEMLDTLPNRKYDVCIVGAGLSGSVLAERFATQFDKTVLVMDKRNHIGGACYDYIDSETGIRVPKYGAHLFHTSSTRAWEYLQEFSKWIPYNHSELAFVDDKYVPIPVNIDTVNTLFELNISSVKEMNAWLEQERIQYNRSPANAEEMALSRVGRRLYHLIYKPLLVKQWNQFPAFLTPDFASHVSVRSNHETGYYSDPYQALPSGGYTAMFENLLKHDKIDVSTGVNYFSVRNHLTCGKTFYTGPIDSYFADSGWGKLEYRSLESKRMAQYNVTVHSHQPGLVVNYPKLETPYSRVVEYRHLPGQKSSHTVYFQEYFSDNGEPYYPVRNKRNNDLFSKYKKMAEKEKGVVFVGRLASYEYLDMDETILTALEVFDGETKAIQESIS